MAYLIWLWGKLHESWIQNWTAFNLLCCMVWDAILTPCVDSISLALQFNLFCSLYCHWSSFWTCACALEGEVFDYMYVCVLASFRFKHFFHFLILYFQQKSAKTLKKWIFAWMNRQADSSRLKHWTLVGVALLVLGFVLHFTHGKD